tara:strand:+ start:17593 stop:18477 length:885 start_codon:yes stop_codon:yes gene_type:complete
MFIKKYQSYLKNERRYSFFTTRSYLIDLNQFFNYLGFNSDNFHSIKSADVRDWIIHLKDKNLSAKTINRKISSLKSFFNFCEIELSLDNNPAQKIRSLKEEKRLPSVVSESSLKLLFESPDTFEQSFNGLRDKFIIDLLYQSGLRLSELINLEIDNFDKKNKFIKILGKRNKERIIPITDCLIKLFQSYIQERSKIQMHPDAQSYLFVTKKGKKTYPKMIYRIVNFYLSKFSSLNKTSPHVLRHAFATHLLNNGADLNVIKKILGHSSLMSTQVYTHVSSEKIKKVYSSTHPRG